MSRDDRIALVLTIGIVVSAVLFIVLASWLSDWL